jgi:hypothetical protein
LPDQTVQNRFPARQNDCAFWQVLAEKHGLGLFSGTEHTACGKNKGSKKEAVMHRLPDQKDMTTIKYQITA